MVFKDLDAVVNYQHKFKEKILLYIELVYSESSELSKIMNLNDRKVQACLQAGLKKHDMEDIMALRDKDVNTLIYLFLSLTQPLEQQLLMSDLQLYWDIQRQLLSPVDESDISGGYDFKLRLSEKSGLLLTRIRTRFNEIYRVDDLGDETKKMVEGVIRMMPRPEDRVKSQSV